MLRTVQCIEVVAATRAHAKGLTDLYFADGCLVCADAQRQAMDPEESRMKRLKEAQDGVTKRMLRRPDTRDENLAEQFGFRKGELIGGYD